MDWQIVKKIANVRKGFFVRIKLSLEVKVHSLSCTGVRQNLQIIVQKKILPFCRFTKIRKAFHIDRDADEEEFQYL